MDEQDGNTVIRQDDEREQTAAAHPKLELVSTSGKKASRPAECIVDVSKVSHWKDTQDALLRLEELFSSKVLSLYVHDDFTLSVGEVTELYKHLAFIGKQKRLVLVLYGLGGNAVAAYRLVRLLRRFAETLTVVVPDKACSAMTMLALGADEVYTGPLTVFSPIDTSITRHPLAPKDAQGNPVTVEIFQVKKYLELVESDGYKTATDFRQTPHSALSEHLHPIFLGTIQRASSLSKRLMADIMRTHLTDPVAVEEITTALNDDYPTHSYPILPEDLERLGLTIKTMTDEQNKVALDLCTLNEALALGNTEVKGDMKKTFRRAVLIETPELRSFYSAEREEKNVDNKWTSIKFVGEYRRAAIVRTQRGYYEALVLSAKNFRTWLTGEEVVVE